MAITSKFYQGPILHTDWADYSSLVGGQSYGVEQLTHYAATSGPGDRVARISAGNAWGWGVVDENDANIDVTIPSVGSGTRYDMIAIERNWTTKTTTVVRVQGTSVKAIPAGRLAAKGGIDHQPLWLVQVTAGSSVITSFTDLRVFGGGTAGMQVANKEALGYLKFPGAIVDVGAETYQFKAGASDFVKVGHQSATPVSMQATGQAVFQDGLNRGSTTQFLMQAGSAVLQTNTLSYATLFFPATFPNGLVTAILMNGDDSLLNDMHPIPDRDAGDYYQKHKLYFSIYAAKSGVRTRNWPSQTFRINYILIGW